MRLSALVEASRRVAGVSGRLGKIAIIAELLSRVPPEEIEIAVAFLSGSYRQQKLNVGYAALETASGRSPAETSSLELSDVDRSFEQISRVPAGKGSTSERQ